ncbi:Zinc/iron permease [Fistulina hepatica ATCC 64428]|uniref:Zinc/iron permease n=1 Tax=Fistulina hepatica ATCC 64428 TaxID=1128425 RepID=A0A0D7A382_9AGAR|nr:Zinc/iron permease [Fistulina hepatica ATCC 64428]
MLSLLVMSLFLGAASFGCGMLPLAFVFSKNLLSRLSALGTGLLLGTALGVIIPEGIETIHDAVPQAADLPVSGIAFSLLCGFTFMLAVEQLIATHSHETENRPRVPRSAMQDIVGVEFDAEMGDRELEDDFMNVELQSPGQPYFEDPLPGRERALPLTFGLVIHSLADGLALGASFLESESSRLSWIVFFALLVHKAPTALALTTSLMAYSLPRTDCRKHLAAFSSSTPLGAILAYGLFSFLGAGKRSDWAGYALLVSGGSFLYVATVLQPLSSHSEARPSEDMSRSMRVLHIVAGIFVPFVMSSLLGHGH